MLQRIAAIIVTVAGVVLALVVGFWVLIFLGLIALVAATIYFVRTRFGSKPAPRTDKVIEGEYSVVEDKEHKNDE